MEIKNVHMDIYGNMLIGPCNQVIDYMITSEYPRNLS